MICLREYSNIKFPIVHSEVVQLKECHTTNALDWLLMNNQEHGNNLYERERTFAPVLLQANIWAFSEVKEHKLGCIGWSTVWWTDVSWSYSIPNENIDLAEMSNKEQEEGNRWAWSTTNQEKLAALAATLSISTVRRSRHCLDISSLTCYLAPPVVWQGYVMVGSPLFFIVVHDTIEIRKVTVEVNSICIVSPSEVSQCIFALGREGKYLHMNSNGGWVHTKSYCLIWVKGDEH